MKPVRGIHPGRLQAAPRALGSGHYEAAHGDHRHLSHSKYDTFLSGTTSEMTLLSASYPSIRKADRVFHLYSIGYIYNNTGADQTVRFRVRISAITPFDHTTVPLASGNLSRAFQLMITVVPMISPVDKFLSSAHLLVGDIGTGGLSPSASQVVDQALQTANMVHSFHNGLQIDITATMSNGSMSLTANSWAESM